MYTGWCDYFRMEFSVRQPLEPVYGQCFEMGDCEVIRYLINPAWLDAFVAFCGFGSW